MTFAGLVRAIHPVGIELTGTDPPTQTCHTSPVRLRAGSRSITRAGIASSGGQTTRVERGWRHG